MALSWTSFCGNADTNYGYISEAKSSLAKAKEAPVLEEKVLRVNEAIQTYQEGPNLEKLQATALILENLSHLNSTAEIEQVNTLIEDVRESLSNEFFRNVHTTRAFAMAILQMAFFVVALVGTLASYSKWSDDDQHFTIGITAMIMFGIFLLWIV